MASKVYLSFNIATLTLPSIMPLKNLPNSDFAIVIYAHLENISPNTCSFLQKFQDLDVEGHDLEIT